MNTNTMNTMNTKTKSKLRKGFAAMSLERRREIASMGGRAAHAKGTAHEFTSEEARQAGRKGGLERQAKRRAKGGWGGKA